MPAPVAGTLTPSLSRKKRERELLENVAGGVALPRIRFEGVSKHYGTLCVIDNLDLEIGRGEFVSFLGPSGSGKTTMLMMLAGFEAPTAGAIWLDGNRIDRLRPHRRNMGVVFQNYALFPHMTVVENIGFPLRMRRVSRS